MARTTFPTAADSSVIRMFLRGDKSTGQHHPYPVNESCLWLVSGRLTLKLDTSSGSTVAWFASDGSLQAKVSQGFGSTYSVHAINAIMRELTPSGQPKQVEHEVRDVACDINGTHVARTHHWYFDEQPVDQDEPFVLAGPVGVIAYQQNLKAKP